MQSIIPFVHEMFEKTLQSGDVVVDATLGNGHDSLFLSKLVGDRGHVYAFDIQQEAIDQAEQLFRSTEVTNITPFLKGHEHAASTIRDQQVTQISGAIFNLGYLPGSDQSVTTNETTTVQAINGLFDLLKPAGHIGMVIYPGHPEGQQEKEALMDYFKTFPSKLADVATYQMANRSERAPFAVIIQKK